MAPNTSCDLAFDLTALYVYYTRLEHIPLQLSKILCSYRVLENHPLIRLYQAEFELHLGGGSWRPGPVSPIYGRETQRTACSRI